MLGDILAVFVAAICFGVIYRAPWSELPHAGFISTIGWIVYRILLVYDDVLAMLAGAAAIALFCEIWSRWRRQPVIIYLIPCIIPLVPGGQAYETMLSFLQGDYLLGVEQLVKTLFLSGAIAGGIMVVSSSFRYYKISTTKGGCSGTSNNC